MERTYYALPFRFDGYDAFLLWYSDDRDGVIVNESGQILCFDNLNALQQWADTQRITVDGEDVQKYDLEALQKWTEYPAKSTIDCATFLNVLNLFMDVRASIEQRNTTRDDPENNDLYDQLFFGNNLPAITPSGEHYVPQWSEEDIHRFRQLLVEGLLLFREHLYAVKS